MPIAVVTNLARYLEEIKRDDLWIYAAAGGTANAYWDADFREGVALVFGAEKKGLRPLVRRRCDAEVSIPLAGPVESLNVSVAAAVMLYEAARQRRALMRRPGLASPDDSASSSEELRRCHFCSRPVDRGGVVSDCGRDPRRGEARGLARAATARLCDGRRRGVLGGVPSRGADRRGEAPADSPRIRKQVYDLPMRFRGISDLGVRTWTRKAMRVRTRQP